MAELEKVIKAIGTLGRIQHVLLPLWLHNRFKIVATIPRCQKPNTNVTIQAQAYRTDANYAVECQALATPAPIKVLAPYKPLPGPLINDTQCPPPTPADQYGK